MRIMEDSRKPAAKNFEERVVNKEFTAFMPSPAVKRIFDWKHAALRDKTENSQTKSQLDNFESKILSLESS